MLVRSCFTSDDIADAVATCPYRLVPPMVFLRCQKQSSEITKQGRRHGAFKVLILLLLFLLREQLSRISLQASSSVALKCSSNMVCPLEVPSREGRERDCLKGRLQKTWIRGGYSRPAHRPPSIHPSIPNFYHRMAKSPVSLKHQSGACSEIKWTRRPGIHLEHSKNMD